MQNQDFTTTILVDQSPEEAFAAINKVSSWWNEDITGSTDTLGSTFKYRYRDVHATTLRIDELVPGKKVVWHVVENYFNFTEDKTEWTGDTIIFEISTKGNQTEVRFSQNGLTPLSECYNVCREAWSHFINESLFALITTGKGDPVAKDDSNENFNEELREKHGIN
ncbi:SRPBCC domain-containing protein [Pseudoflavitalea sp. G-6-1-2]|uniref:SRPBCC family protein n=1 Tax=Pseudoflavitalea sp. G-6-1-2 TaxID=2728841 RepID=UPI00146B474E|nr:SRPBCC domain-containing protein [Pseudoflavitalea sp. G-6-1-2]NML19236.1 SRPBCC domain-containing protein [Pseudoflavitalea sp. G-6-1-2]